MFYDFLNITFGLGITYFFIYVGNALFNKYLETDINLDVVIDFEE